jgi:glycosyltransferase involved in cell wall biosynthesis
MRYAATLGVASRVRFHGHVDDTRPVLADADAALCSSREEGLGIALLEAMAMERPVVALPVGGVPEFVEDEVTGWLARDLSVAALATRMREAMASGTRRQVLGRAARAAVIGTYSLKAMCDGYGVVYRCARAPLVGSATSAQISLAMDSSPRQGRGQRQHTIAHRA